MSVDKFAQLLKASTRVVFFTGAGISTESGIPDFRSPGGIWTKMAPIDFNDFVRSSELRREAWRRRFAMEETFATAKPNDGHRAIASLIVGGKASAVITQNIDNLHQDSGVPTDKVIELHGNTRYARCLDCSARTELDPIRAHFETHGEPPDCARCGGLLKTATISFGQAMPEIEMQRSPAISSWCWVRRWWFIRPPGSRGSPNATARGLPSSTARQRSRTTSPTS